MDLKYLKYLAKTGAAHLHPHREIATNILTDALDLHNGMKVLEIGCGTGATLVQLGIAYDLQLYGTDLIPEMIKVAERRLKLTGLKNNATVAQVSFNAALPFSNQFFDRVYSESVLGFQDDSSAQLILNEAYRVLKKGGVLVANEAIWKKTTQPEIIPSINQSCIEDFGLRQASEQTWTIDDWLSLFEECGFAVLSSKLLIDHIAGENLGKSNPYSFRIFMSDMLTYLYKIKGFINPVLLINRIKYGVLMRRHYTDGQYIETRLFILKKS